MKKFVSKIVVAATLAMTLLVSSVAFAAGTSVSVKAGAAPKAGEQVKFTVSFASAEKMRGVQADVKASDNLEFVGASSSATDWYGKPKAAGFALAAEKDAALEAVTVTYTYKVKADAKAGDALQFDISGVVVGDINGNALETAISNSSATVKVADATVAPTTKPADKPQTTEKPGTSTDKKDDVPKTGDTTTPVWPFVAVLAACAGVATVALKKKSVQK